MNTTSVKLPNHNLKLIAETTRRLLDEAATGYEYATLIGAELDEFVEQVRDVVGRNINHWAVYETCRPLVGKELTPARLRLWARRVAGNLPRLREGKAVKPWVLQEFEEWAPVEIVHAVPSRSKWDEPGMDYTVGYLAGTPATMMVKKFWTRKAASYVAFLLGFTKKTLRYENPAQLVGLKSYVLLEPKLSGEMPMFEQIHVPSSFMEQNKKVLRGRLRVGACETRQFTWACHRCAVGRDACPFATHPLTYVERPCSSCDNPDATFDLAASKTRCLNCEIAERTKPAEKG